MIMMMNIGKTSDYLISAKYQKSKSQKRSRYNKQKSKQNNKKSEPKEERQKAPNIVRNHNFYPTNTLNPIQHKE